MARVTFAPGVKKEVDDAIDFYEAARNGLGKRFLSEVENAVDKLMCQPLFYPCIHQSFRRCLVNKFPYAVIFSFAQSSDCNYIVAVMHTSRKPNFWFPRVEDTE